MDSMFTREETLKIMEKTPILELPKPDKKEGDTNYWTGKQLFSLILPKDLHMTFKSSICQRCDTCKKEACEHDSFVVVRDGMLVTGTIDEKAIGAFKGRILDKLSRDYGPDTARQFIDSSTKMAIGAIMVRGFTTGIDDEDIPDQAKREIDDAMTQAKIKVEEHVNAYRRGELEQMPGRSLEETLEVEIMKVLGKARDTAGQIAGRHLGMENSAVIMARCGARGSMLNLSQMAGAIGQQAVRGERLSRGYWNRTLPHFKKGDLGSEARGFIKNSYKSGLTPTEYFFHSMGGREGLVDTAVRTSRSGYMQRRLINALEDLKVMQDGSVRNTAGTIIQLEYGEDGIDPTRSVQGDAVDVDDIILSVLGDKGELIAKVQEKGVVSYGIQDRDLLETPEEPEVEEDQDFEMGGGEEG
jgi:DNA-directed RNA polymerase subunit A'